MDVLTPSPVPLAVDMAGRHSQSSSLSEAHNVFPPVPQLVSEKVGGAEGTKLDEDFKEMEKVPGEAVQPV